MPRAPHPMARKGRTQPVLDHVLQKSLDKTGGKYDPETGRYGEIVLNGFATRDHAAEIRRALFRCARYMKYSLKCDIEKAGGGYQLRFTMIDKATARQYINRIPPEQRAYNSQIRVIGED